MPTDQQIDASVATDTESEGTTPVITDDLIKSHPLYKDLEGKHSAARKGMDDANIKVKTLKKALGEDEEESAPVPEATTLQSIAETIKWELKNEKQIELANQNGLFDKYVSEGRSKPDALKLALFDEGITNSAAKAESQRQAQASSPNPGIERSNSQEPTAAEKEQMKQWGYSKETLLKHKEMRQR